MTYHYFLWMQEFHITVKPGDIVVVGTYRLFNNLFEAQIEETTRRGFDQGLSLEDVAWTKKQQECNLFFLIFQNPRFFNIDSCFI